MSLQRSADEPGGLRSRIEWRGIGPSSVLDGVRVSNAMRSLPADAPLDVLVERLAEEDNDALPVIGDDGRCLGVVT